METTPPFLYHVTGVENFTSINQNGLKAGSDGHIYFFDSLQLTIPHLGISVLVSDIICLKQVFLKEYYLLTVATVGISSKIKSDNVMELTAGLQCRVKQKTISSTYIVSYERREVDVDATNRFLEYQSLLTSFSLFHPDSIREAMESGVLRQNAEVYIKAFQDAGKSTWIDLDMLG